MEFKNGDRIKAVHNLTQDVSEFTLLRYEDFGMGGVALVSCTGLRFSSVEWTFTKVEPPIPRGTGVVFLDYKDDLILAKVDDSGRQMYYTLTARNLTEVSGWKHEMGSFSIVPAPQNPEPEPEPEPDPRPELPLIPLEPIQRTEQ